MIVLYCNVMHVLCCVVLCRADASKQVLSNALEVYVNDPVVDWLKGPLDKDNMDNNAEGQGESSGCDSEGGVTFAALRDDVTWEPRRKIANAVRKMDGEHPVTLLVEDLQVG
jgi:hypothetical protein